MAGQKATDGKIEADVYNLDGKTTEKIELPKEIFGVKVNPILLAQAIRVYLANQRLGTHSTKTRSEVTGSTRKIYRQKGTGRARHGDIKAPIFIGGGVAHGPKPQDYALSFPKKMKRIALFGALTDRLNKGKIKIISQLSSIEPKTKKMKEILARLGFVKLDKAKERILLVTYEKLNNIFLAGRNLANFKMLEAKLLNTYDVLTHQNIIFMKEAIPILKEHYFNIDKNKVKKEEPKKEIKSRTKSKIQTAAAKVKKITKTKLRKTVHKS